MPVEALEILGNKCDGVYRLEAVPALGCSACMNWMASKKGTKKSSNTCGRAELATGVNMKSFWVTI